MGELSDDFVSMLKSYTYKKIDGKYPIDYEDYIILRYQRVYTVMLGAYFEQLETLEFSELIDFCLIAQRAVKADLVSLDTALNNQAISNYLSRHIAKKEPTMSSKKQLIIDAYNAFLAMDNMLECDHNFFVLTSNTRKQVRRFDPSEYNYVMKSAKLAYKARLEFKERYDIFSNSIRAVKDGRT